MSSLKRRRQDRRPQLDRIRLDIACNDEQGRFASRADAMSFSARGERIGIEPSHAGPPRFRELDDGRICIFRRRIQVYATKEWVGNWCWNAYVIPLPMAAWVLHHAVTKGGFSLDMAEGDSACRLSDAIDKDPTLSEITLHLSLFGAGLTQ